MFSKICKALALATVLAGAAVTTATAIPYPTTVYQLSIEQQIRDVMNAAARAGLPRVVANQRGQLYVGYGNTGFDVYLQAGQTYFVAARCDQDCRDLMLGVTDVNGQTLMADRSQRDFPGLIVRPTITGTYRVTLALAHCGAYRCQVGAVVMSR